MHIEHPSEPSSNDFRRRLNEIEPLCLRTYTPSLAIINKSSGSYHWTTDGRKLADFSSGVLVANLGHNPNRWWSRVWQYMGLVPSTSGLAGGQTDQANEFLTAEPLTAYNAVTDIEILASERLVKNMRQEPGGKRMEQVLWAASGSEAVQKALWACLDVDAKQDVILATRRGFHGKKGLAGAVTGSESDKERDPRVRFLTFPTEECRDVESRRRPLDLEPYQQELAKLDRELGSRVCCVITEPYLGGGGSFHPQPEYLQMLQKFARDHGAAFILDEIQSNFGRTGPMYAYTHYGLEPDIVCLGKGLGNGIPVSAAVGRADLLGTLGYGVGSDTWSANPLAMAGVLATLDEFETTDALARGKELAKVLEAGLVRLKETKVISAVRGEGCVWGIECQSVGSSAPEEVAIACVEACYRGDPVGRSIHLLGALAGKVIRVSPPLVMPINEAKEYLDAMYGILGAVRGRLAR